MPQGSLTPKQQRFVEEYLIDLNATEAAIRAGYSKTNADKIGPELLGKTRAFVEAAAQRRMATRLMTAEDIVAKLQRIATTDMADFMTWDGPTGKLTLKNPVDIPLELRRCIKSITQHETQHARYLKIELHSKVAALGVLAKYHNLFKRSVASKGLVIKIIRPANAPLSAQEQQQYVTGPQKPIVPQVEFIRPRGAT